MVHFPLLAKTHKFVLSNEQTSEAHAYFNQQPYASLFTPVQTPSIWQHLEQIGLLDAQQLVNYPPTYRFQPKNSVQDQTIIEALAPWFDVEAYFKRFANEQGELSFQLSFADVNNVISTINLLKHLYHSPVVVADDWILVVSESTILSTEWVHRLESILTTLAPTSTTLTTAVQTQLEHLRAMSPTELVTKTINSLEQALNPSAELLTKLNKLTYIGLNNSHVHSLEHIKSQDLSKISLYFSTKIDTNVNSYLPQTIFGQQTIGILDVLNFTNQTFFLIRKSALANLFKNTPYLDHNQELLPELTNLSTKHYAIGNMDKYYSLDRIQQECLHTYNQELLDALSVAKDSSAEQPLTNLTQSEQQLVSRILNEYTPNFHLRSFSTLSPLQAYLACSASTLVAPNSTSSSVSTNTTAPTFSQKLEQVLKDEKELERITASLSTSAALFTKSLACSYNQYLYSESEFGILAQRAFSIVLDARILELLPEQSYNLNHSELLTDPSLFSIPHTLSQSVSTQNSSQAQSQVNSYILMHNAQVLWSDFSFEPESYYVNLENSSLRKDYVASLVVQRLQNIVNIYRPYYSSYHYPQAQINRLLSFNFPSLSCRIDQLHLWLEFKVGSFAMSNPSLGFVGELHGEQRYDTNNLIKIARLRNFGSINVESYQPAQRPVVNFDYVGKYRKFVLYDTTRHHLGEFLRHSATDDFEIVNIIDSRQLSREQTEKFFGFEQYKQKYSNTERVALLGEISRSFTYRELFARILNDETIAEDDFVIIAEDRISLHPQWHQYLNTCFDYANLINKRCELLLLSLPNKVGFNQVQGSLKTYSDNGYVVFNESNIIPLHQNLEIVQLTTFQKQEYPFFCVRKSALRYFEEKLSSFKEVDSYFAGNLVSLLESFKLGSILVPNPILGRDFHPEQERHSHVPAINLVRELTNQIVPINNPDSENFGFNPIACAKSDPNFTGYFTGNPEIDELYFGSNTDISELLLPQLKHELEQRPYGFSNAGFNEDLVSRVKKYVLNMPISTERRDAFLQQNNCEDFKVHNAVIGRNLTEEQKAYLFDIPSFNHRYGDRIISPGELGCAISHVQVLRRAIQDPDLGLDDWVMVVEDDTKLHPQWYRLLNQILLYVRDFMHDRPCIINGAQNQVPHFRLQNSDKFCTTHALLSHVDGYHKVSDEVGIGFTHTPFPAGAGFYLIRKRLLIENRNIIEGKIDWVGDHFSHYYPFRHYTFAYTNPMLGYDDPDLVSMLEAERVAGIEENKRKRRAIPLTNPGIYVTTNRVWIKQAPGQDIALLQAQFKDCNIVPFIDYSSYTRDQLEELFDFEQHQKLYGREPTMDELNYSLQEFNLFKTISEQKASDFHFHFVARGDSEFISDWMYRTNCISDYIDTRLDLNTLIIYVGNDKAPQDFSKVSTAQEFGQQTVFTTDEHIYPVNADQNLCYTTGMNHNGDRGYIMLKFYCTHMFDHLPNGKPFCHAGDLVYMTPYEHKTIVFASPNLVIDAKAQTNDYRGDL